MKEIVIISGKGGTGKTTLTASLAALWEDKITADCDVDAADLHLLLAPKILKTHDFYSGLLPVVDRDKCTLCGRCARACEFKAISPEIEIERIDCEGCAVCYYVCPENAITLQERHCGHWYHSETRFGPLVHAKLGIAEENSGKLVTLIKKEANILAESKGFDTILIDGSPGIGCPVISSLSGASFAVIVTEPTVSGIHDLDRVLKLTAHFGIKSGVVINKADLNPEASIKIETRAAEAGSHVIGRIPYDQAFTRAMVKGKTVIEFEPGSAAEAIRKISSKILSIINQGSYNRCRDRKNVVEF